MEDSILDGALRAAALQHMSRSVKASDVLCIKPPAVFGLANAGVVGLLDSIGLDRCKPRSNAIEDDMGTTVQAAAGQAPRGRCKDLEAMFFRPTALQRQGAQLKILQPAIKDTPSHKLDMVVTIHDVVKVDRAARTAPHSASPSPRSSGSSAHACPVAVLQGRVYSYEVLKSHLTVWRSRYELDTAGGRLEGFSELAKQFVDAGAVPGADGCFILGGPGGGGGGIAM